MVLTHLKYGILSWGNAGKTSTNALNKIHNKIINVLKEKEIKETKNNNSTKKDFTMLSSINESTHMKLVCS